MTLECSGHTYSQIWHCFGNQAHRIRLGTVQKLLDVSGTNVLPINTHQLTRRTGRDGLLIGFGDVRYYSLVENRPAVASMIKMLNINLQNSARTAIEKAMLAVDITEERIIKLEVLDTDFSHSNDSELLKAVACLSRDESLTILPLHSCSLSIARRLIDMGCPATRVMGSPIGSMKGISDPATLGRICQLPVPVILDGGVDSASTAIKAFSIGVSAVLINSMLFRSGRGPVAEMEGFRTEVESVLPHSQGAPDKSHVEDATR